TETLARRLYFDSYYSFIITDFFEGLHYGHYPRKCGICKKMGSWFAYGEDKLGNGREAAKAFLREHPDCADEIEHKVRLACGLEFDDDAPSEVELTDQPETDEFDELYAIDGSAMLDDDDE
ncbi:MAG: hypothetical protein KH292_06735, partial [Collinsella sp.]|nr:hypothetical protein [Collinsella sp.]